MIWAISWRTEKPCVLQSMGSQRIGHDLATEQQQMYQLHLNFKKNSFLGTPWRSSGQDSVSLMWPLVWALVWEMGSHKPHGMAKKIKKFLVSILWKYWKIAFSSCFLKIFWSVFSHQQLKPPVNRCEKDGAEFCNSSLLKALSGSGKNATSEPNAWSR